MTLLPLEPVARNGGLGWREKRDAFGGRHQLLSACFSLLPSGRCPSPMHAVSWVIHQIGHCHQWSRDQWEHESNGINENSLKGIDMGVGKEGLSPSEFLYLGKYQGLGAIFGATRRILSEKKSQLRREDQRGNPSGNTGLPGSSHT